MRAYDLIEHLEDALRDIAKMFRVVDFLHLAAEDLRYTAYAHDLFLPAARDWQEYLHRRPPHAHLDDQGRRLRARLGGTSRQLYRFQRSTFEDAVRVICPEDLSILMRPQILDHLWYLFLRIEKRVLAEGRDLT